MNTAEAIKALARKERRMSIFSYFTAAVLFFVSMITTHSPLIEGVVVSCFLLGQAIYLKLEESPRD